MNITLMLAWFDEPEEMLHRCVTSAGVIADRVVAADGAYKLVADRAPTSPASQRRAIERAATEAGLDVDFLPARLWEGQVQKRDALLRAATRGGGEDDFVMPIDADWVLHGDRQAVRRELAAATAEQFRVQITQPANGDHNGYPHSWHRNRDGKTWRQELLFRVLGEMCLERLHWWYSGVRADGTRVGLAGGAELYPRATLATLRADFLIEHRCMFRDTKQLERNRIFCERRDHERELTGAER